MWGEAGGKPRSATGVSLPYNWGGGELAVTSHFLTGEGQSWGGGCAPPPPMPLLRIAYVWINLEECKELWLLSCKEEPEGFPPQNATFFQSADGRDWSEE